MLLRETRRCSPFFMPVRRLFCKTVSTEINVTVVVNTKYAYDIMIPIKGITASVLKVEIIIFNTMGCKNTNSSVTVTK